MRSMRSRRVVRAAWSMGMGRYRLRGRSNVVATGCTTGASLPAANETKVTHGQYVLRGQRGQSPSQSRVAP